MRSTLRPIPALLIQTPASSDYDGDVDDSLDRPLGAQLILSDRDNDFQPHASGIGLLCNACDQAK